MEDKQKSLPETVAEAFDEMVKENISKRGYDLYKTHDGEYHCRKCTFSIPYHENCPHCKTIIDWTKIILPIDGHIIELLKDDDSVIIYYQIKKEFYDKVKSMPDSELMNFHEQLYDNLEEQEVELIKASNQEVRRRALEADKLLRRLFNRQQHEKWNDFLKRIEVKATKYVLEKSHR